MFKNEVALNEYLKDFTHRIASIPKNQLMMQKIVINQALENMGLFSTQTLATLFDGVARHSPEGIAFKELCERVGFKKAVLLRDNPVPLSKL